VANAEQRSAAARVAAKARWAGKTPEERSAQGRAGQAGLLARYEREARRDYPGLTDAEYDIKAREYAQYGMDNLTDRSIAARQRQIEQERQAARRAQRLPDRLPPRQPARQAQPPAPYGMRTTDLGATA
jgi:hypothetical protein